MTKLSPAAQAIWDAYQHVDCDPYQIDPRQAGLAAALRALADQVAYGHGSSIKKSAIIDEDEVLDIATELENHP